VPKFAEVYGQVKIALPGSTMALVGLSEFLVSHWWVAPLILIATYDVLSRLSPKQAGVARVLIPVVVVAGIAWMIFALFTPLIGLHGIGGRR
jgi:type II secretory pathway component PulF